MRLEFIIVLVTYVSMGTIIALLSRRYGIRTLRDYYVAGGMLKGLIAAGTYAATTYSAFMMVGLVGLTYATGVCALGFELLYLAATVFLLSTAGYEIWRISKQRNWITPAQMLGDLYGSRLTSLTAAAVYLFAMIPYLAAQVQGLRTVFRYGGFSEDVALTISATITYAWIVIAGVWSVALTDLYQGILSLTSGIVYLIWAVLYLVPFLGLDHGTVFKLLGENGYLGVTDFWKVHVFLAYTIPWIFFAITNPQVVVRLYMPRDEKSYKRMVMLFSLYGFLYTIVVVTVGLVAAGIALTGRMPANLKWDEVTPLLLGYMYPLLGSLVAVSIIAAAISTANSIVLAVSSSITRDLLSTEKLIVARLIDAFLVLAATVIAAQNVGFIVEMSVLTSVILLPLAPVTLLGIYRGRLIGGATRTACTLSMATGVLMSTVYSILHGPRKALTQPFYGLPLPLWTLLISTGILLIGHLIDILTKR
ncbi:MAG: sodium:solute symporter family protein [Desulfurococcaceae archaeon]